MSSCLNNQFFEGTPMFHNSSNRYTGYNMTRSQRVARDVADVSQNVVRTVANTVAIKPQRLVSQIFNLNHHVDYISSRHQQRVDKRIAARQPVNSQQAALDPKNAELDAQAKQAKQDKQEERNAAISGRLQTLR
jgi:hypothetical protein